MTATPRTAQVAKLMVDVDCDPAVAGEVVAIVRTLEQELAETKLTLDAVRLGRNLILDANQEMVCEVEDLRAQLAAAA